MSASPMLDTRHSLHAHWSLGQGEAMSLRVGPGARQLQVLEGRIWITSRGGADRAVADVWLHAGDVLDLSHGSQWVMEAWPVARFQLLVPPAACDQRRATAGALRRLFSGRLRWWTSGALPKGA